MNCACQTSLVSGLLISILPTIVQTSPIALIWKPFLIWLDNLFFHPLSWRVLGTQDTADKSLTGHKDLFILFSINKLIILQLFNLLDFNTAVRRKRFMRAARCFVRTEKHSLNSDLARRSSKPLTKVLSLSLHFYCAHKAPTGILVYPSMIRSSQTSSSCRGRSFWVVKSRPVNINVNGYNYNNTRAFTAME